ncbi:MFS general substrate transporter [Annulohypoxylon truncatum]|uniref:MFS general substrate transporter n=1 Tax=Annulohypoxylon truncatum TaxID=327061 RepID=UPI0020081123|nr:MFS general substrate transporter [Annulohypoxylon truncatum]KAI1208055.1 MFS general substrate transporter [Annulohypoxylon truncatum]
MKNLEIDKETGAHGSTAESDPATGESRVEDDEKLEKSESNSDSINNSEIASAYSYRERLDVPDHASSRAISRIVSEVRDGIESRRDLDLEPAQPEDKTPITDDPNIVNWNGPDDPENPRNWAFSKKWGAVFIVSIFTFVSPVCSSMVAPGLRTIGAELDIPEAFMQNIVLSIFVLAYALGPLVWGPLSELYGRVPVLQLSNLGFLGFTLGCGFARTRGQLIAFRFLSGLGGSASLAIGGGVLGDLFAAEQRGRAMSMYSLAPLLGPAVGPIAGAFITQSTTWRWAFWATAAADAAIQIAGLVFLRETYAPVLLDRKRSVIAREKGVSASTLRTPFDDAGKGGSGSKSKSVWSTLGTAMTRPFRLLATQVIVQCIALYMMYVYGLMYLMLASFPTLFTSPPPAGYGMSIGIGGLNYISLGLGFFLGAQICAPLQDRVYARLKRRYHGRGRPEYRVPMMVPGAVMIPVGLLVYGWTAEYKTHWIGPNVGAVIFAAGAIICFQCLQGFLVDSYLRYAASAVGAATVLRSLAGFGFPLFAPSMYDRLGYGWGNTLMALLGVVIGWPGPFLLWKYGERLRKRSPFAAGG